MIKLTPKEVVEMIKRDPKALKILQEMAED